MNTITEAALYRLMSWLSPFYPVGGFSYSHGLDYAVEARLVTDAATLKLFIETVLSQGAGRSDGALFVAAWRAAERRMGPACWDAEDSTPSPPLGAERVGVRWGDGDAIASSDADRVPPAPIQHRCRNDSLARNAQAGRTPPHPASPPQRGGEEKNCDTMQVAQSGSEPDTPTLDEVADLALAWRGSKEMALESEAQGTAFLSTTHAAWPAPLLEEFARDRASVAFPVAVAVAAAAHRIPLAPALAAYLHAFASNLVSAGMRLIPLGQSEGQDIVAKLEPAIAACSQSALEAPLETVGTAAPLIDWCSMRHETQYTRLFRS